MGEMGQMGEMSQLGNMGSMGGMGSMMGPMGSGMGGMGNMMPMGYGENGLEQQLQEMQIGLGGTAGFGGTGLDGASTTCFEQQWSTILTEFTASVEGPTSLPTYVAFGEAFAGS